MPQDATKESSSERKGKGNVDRSDVVDGLNRRHLLKSAGVGAGLSTLGQQVAGSSPDDTVRFSTVGLVYRIEDDVEIETVTDCSARSWMQRRDEVFLFQNNLSEAERSRVRERENVVATDRFHSPPVRELRLANKPYLPTNLGSDLRPSKGVTVQGDHSQPTARVVTAGRDIKIITSGNVRRLSPESEMSVELEPRSVTVKRRKVVPLGRETTGPQEGQEAMRVEYESEEVIATPIIAVQNRGELPYQIVENPSEVI